MKYLIMMLVFTTTLAFADSPPVAPAALTSKGIIESLNLEEQSIYFHGQEYIFASDILIIDKNNIATGLIGLNPGQVVEYTIQKNKAVQAYRQDKQDSQKVTYIKILSDNRKEDDVH